MTEDLDRLLRWEVAGGTWQVLGRRPDSVTISLCRCDGGEEVERFSSSAPDLRAHLGDRQSSDPEDPSSAQITP